MNLSLFTTSSNALPIGNATAAAKVCGLILFLSVQMTIMAQTPCENGLAGQYPCDGLDLMSVRSFEEMGGVAPGNGNDCWGWAKDGREFVLFGRSDGTSIVEITDPVNPVMIANVPTASVPSLWRDIKVIGDFAYIVSEAGEHGLQIVDLSSVPSLAPMSELEVVTHYTEFGSAHNVVANPTTGFIYGVGTDTFGGGLHIVDVSEPASPNLVGSWEEQYIHDAQVVVYDGEDNDYNGREIAFVFSGFSGCHIVNVEDKTDCYTISSLVHPEFVYPHQGWLTEDHRFVLMNDEMDEAAGITETTRTWVFDVQDLDNPEVIGYHEGSLSVTDHNLYTHQGKVYQANYYAGLQVLDILDAAGLGFEQVASFDTNPFSNQTGTSGGAWSVYPYFESGNIAISTQSHLFIVAPSGGTIGVGEAWEEPAMSVRQEGDVVHITCTGYHEEDLMVFDAAGRLQAEWLAMAGTTMSWMVEDWSPGVYVIRGSGGLQHRFIVH